ncbi:uncharacterized protein LOC130993889 [Salvia miltiorrhiza]|uniref:uncharacterized protein LOC130993889 n=1 Tax=Salvia miltiorrhiza TaxID=226208 RepID=UPI0025AC2B36|nr:uncharacterized protein LOC130993889 [Salvia miltiorrhiza]
MNGGGGVRREARGENGEAAATNSGGRGRQRRRNKGEGNDGGCGVTEREDDNGFIDEKGGRWRQRNKGEGSGGADGLQRGNGRANLDRENGGVEKMHFFSLKRSDLHRNTSIPGLPELGGVALGAAWTGGWSGLLLLRAVALTEGGRRRAADGGQWMVSDVGEGEGGGWDSGNLGFCSASERVKFALTEGGGWRQTEGGGWRRTEGRVKEANGGVEAEGAE